jgi:hypothetical protein
MGESVNDSIDRRNCKVSYTSFDKAVDMINSLGKGVLLAKLDVKGAFRLMPLHPSQFELLGFKLCNKYYFDKCLTMGCASACYLFEKSFLKWVLVTRSGLSNVVHYLDDFLLHCSWEGGYL